MTNAPDAFSSRQSSQFTILFQPGKALTIRVMLISWFVVVVMLAGLLLWALGNGKVAEIGRLAFAIGLFWTCAMLTGKSVRLL